jgi:hypothetical protein
MATASPHLLSGLGKQWSPPQFSKDEPRRKFKTTLSQPLASFFGPASQHPDEEKGRSIRSYTRVPTDSDSFLSGGLAAPFDSLNIGLSDDSNGFLDDWRAARDSEEDVTLVDKVLSGLGKVNAEEEPTFAVTKQSDAELWSTALEHAVAGADGKITLRSVKLASLCPHDRES